jgi:hypothetical protein
LLVEYGFVMQGLNQRPKTKIHVVGTGSMNLAEYASVVDQKDFDLSIPLTIPGGFAVDPFLSLTVCSTISHSQSSKESKPSLLGELL